MNRTQIRAAIAPIAREEFGIRTLDIRGGDDLDFHDLHVGRIERALTRAYHAGGVAAMSRLFNTKPEGEPPCRSKPQKSSAKS